MSAPSEGERSLALGRCGRVQSRMCPLVMGMMSRKAITVGEESTMWQFGVTASASAECGMEDARSASGGKGYALAMRQKGQDAS